MKLPNLKLYIYNYIYITEGKLNDDSIMTEAEKATVDDVQSDQTSLKPVNEELIEDTTTIGNESVSKVVELSEKKDVSSEAIVNGEEMKPSTKNETEKEENKQELR